MLTRFLRVYYGVSMIWLLRMYKKALRKVGELMKVYGRRLLILGDDAEPNWSIELLLKCYLVEVEIHLPVEVYRGPVYALYHKFYGEKRSLIFKFNWIAKRSNFSTASETTGYCAFRIEDYGPPRVLPNGDVWFGFNGGYAVIFFGSRPNQAVFSGGVETPRVYTYF